MTLPIARLEELCEKATERPWHLSECLQEFDIRFGDGYITQIICDPMKKIDGELIAESRNALPDLLAELKRRGDALDVTEKALKKIDACRTLQYARKTSREALAYIRSGGNTVGDR